MSERRHVGSTYRVQLNGLGFAGATALVPFLHELGVETCYVSPVTRARAASSHGYDVIDPTVLDPSLGTRAEFENLLATLADRGMGLLIDIVPNHMAASLENRFFVDVLRRGQDSRYAAYFDIAWDENDGKILLPVLGKPLADAVEAGEIRLELSEDTSEPCLAYVDQRYPVSPGSADGSDSLSAVLSRQHYQLADWRLANDEVNYRRFFDINELIGVRQEDPRVFAETHQLVAELAKDPRVVGFRVDHIDGLYDPAGYLASLRQLVGRMVPEPVVVVEKILARTESLPDWPVEGTTGYEFGNELLGLFIDEPGAAALARAVASATGDPRSFAERSLAAKRRAVDTLFAHQLAQVSRYFVAALVDGPAKVDQAVVTMSVKELTSCLEVYRTYRDPGVGPLPEDLQRIHAAAAQALASLSTDDAAVLGRIVEVLAGDLEAGSPAWRAVGAWQQLTGPVAAKGVEDTALYDSGQLLAACDVGSDPDQPALLPADVHDAMARRQQGSAFGLSATSTHDSKRSYDVRCRLAVLSETADEWEATIAALEHDVLSGSDSSLPDVADRRYVYETLVGAWPVDGHVGSDFARRISEHLVKAAREAKRHSGWIDPDLGYEGLLTGFAERLILGDPPAGRAVVERAVEAVECAGVTNSLASVLVKTTAPGVPDMYQGDDTWFSALVDPDNRAPLDVAAHAGLLAGLPPVDADADHGRAVDSLLTSWRSGAVKQLVLRNALHVRRKDPDLFAAGRYERLAVTGAKRDHVFAFARVHQDRWAICVVPRLVQLLCGPGRFPVGVDVWSDTEIIVPPKCPMAMTDALTGRPNRVADGRLPLSLALATLPVALLQG